MLRLQLYAITATITVFLVSCSNKVEDPKPELRVCSECLTSQAEHPLIPLDVGNTWVYEYTEYDSDGNVILHDPDFELVVEETRTFMDQQWYYIRIGDVIPHETGWAVTYFLARNSEAGFCVGSVFQGVFMQYLHPASVDEDYYEVLGDSAACQWFEFGDDSAEVTVPSGTYNCHYYISAPLTEIPCLSYNAPGNPHYGVGGDKLYERIRFFANQFIRPGLGIVKFETRAVGDAFLLQKWVLKETNVSIQ